MKISGSEEMRAALSRLKDPRLIFEIALAVVVAGLVAFQFPVFDRIHSLHKQQQYHEHVIGLLRLAQILDHLAPAKGDNFQQALALRDMVYKSIELKDAPAGINFDDFGQAFSDSTRDPHFGQACGGLTILYMAALEARGIPARYVGLFTDNDVTTRNFDSHATVEFYYKGRWFASDPTFNVMFRRNGRFLSYAELYELVRQHKSYEVTSNGFRIEPGRALANYYTPLPKLLRYVAIDRGETTSEAPPQAADSHATYLPRQWDGYLHFSGGEKARAGYTEKQPSNSLYNFLEDGPFR
jgi:hypothetical protein